MKGRKGGRKEGRKEGRKKEKKEGRKEGREEGRKEYKRVRIAKLTESMYLCKAPKRVALDRGGGLAEKILLKALLITSG